jgi:hypothetical protein
MAESDFWRDLADKFGQLSDPDGLIFIEWSEPTGSSGEEHFQIRQLRDDPRVKPTQASFEALARIAGRAFGGGRSHLDNWLFVLKQYAWERKEIEIQIDEVSQRRVRGIIRQAVQRSTEHCGIIQMEWLERERHLEIMAHPREEPISGIRALLKAEIEGQAEAYKHRATERTLEQLRSKAPTIIDVPIVGTNTPTFPNRAKWTNDRLKEREWDWNHPNRFGGPDRKTVKKMLAGKYVQIGALGKFVTALNHKKIKGKTVDIIEVPND